MRFLLALMALFVLGGAVQADTLEGKTPEIEIKFPKIAGLEPFLNDYEKRVKTKFLQAFEEAKAEGTVRNNWSLEVSSELTFDQALMVLAFTGYEYQGGAHGLPVLDVAYFDKKTKKPLKQEDVLTKDALARLSKISRTSLVKQGYDANDDWMLKGTAPTRDNFRLVIPREDYLEVLFFSYQVAPYASGVPSVKIPWKQAGSLFQQPYRP